MSTIHDLVNAVNMVEEAREDLAATLLGLQNDPDLMREAQEYLIRQDNQRKFIALNELVMNFIWPEGIDGCS